MHTQSIHTLPRQFFCFVCCSVSWPPARPRSLPLAPLRRAFNLCDGSSLEDDGARVSFAGDGVVSLPIQENDPACSGTVCNISAVCEVMTDDARGSEVTVAFCCL